MEILNSYLEYRRFKPEYKEWKQKRDEKASKKEKYFESAPLSEAEKQKQLQKIKVILNAVDTMDEFSQQKAENTEIATAIVKNFVIQIASYAGLGLAMVLMFSKAGAALERKFAAKFPNMAENFGMFTIAGSAIPALLASIPLISWGAKSEIFASKIGRHEAVATELNSINQFAILDEKQKEEVNKKAEKVVVQDENIAQKAYSSFKEAFSTVKNLFSQNEEVKEYLKKENEKFEAQKSNFDKPLSREDIQTAKEEQEIITSIVEDVDTASQDYAEDVEFATGTLIASSAALGALAGFTIKGVVNLLKKVMPKTMANSVRNAAGKMNKKSLSGGAFVVKILPMILGAAGAIGASIVATKLQKQASRVARFTVMKNLENNPEKLIYVDEEKLKDINPEVKNKKENIFEFYKRLFRENKEYNQYLKENKKKDKQYKIALNEIELSEKQQADAKRLQQNVFKAFNKIDDKSQTYSENTEAFGEIVKSAGSAISALGGCIISLFMVTKLKNNPSTKSIIKSLIPMYVGLIPAIALDFFVTKEQKNASRVAHMFAIKDLEDYRHFIDYDNLKPEDVSKDKTETAPSNKEAVSNLDNVFQRFAFKRK